MTATPRPPHRITRLAHALRARFPRAGAALFWGWNLVFLAFMTFGFAPNLLPELVEASRSGDIATGFLLHAMVLTVIPALAVGVALTRLARAPERLFAFGYGIEGPLMLLVGVRLFVIRELTPAAAAMLAIAGLGLAAYLWVLLDRMPMDARGSLAAGVRVVGLSLLVLVGLYAAAWITFYAVPLAVQAVAFVRHDILGNLSQALADLWRSIRDFDWRSLAAWRELPLIVFGSILFALTAALFVAMPVVIATLYARAWAAAMRVAGAHLGRRTAGALAAGTVAAAVALVAAADRQPQAAAFAALATPPADAAAARALTGREAELRAGLLNAYLARYRYFSAVGELRHLRDLYTNTAVDLTAARAARVQRAYEALVRPLLYRSVVAAERRTAPGTRTPQGLAFTADAARAAELYQRYFDRPIDEAERPAIVAAVRATWMVDQAEAARLAVDDREVHLERQDVRVTEHGDWAELELHEVYRNRTTRRQEVVYHFTLPESAVVTGVWLGTSDDRDQRFAFRVAPRGAAQQVYREEVRRRVDPALVEQIGPRQYRLRVFPVEPREWGFGEDGRRMRAIDGPPLHLWLTWRVLAADGAWPLPRLGELRNVYWDASTARTVAGAAVAGADPAWLPAAVPAQSPITPAPHRVDFPDGRTVLAQPAADIDAAALAPGTRVAVVVDRSRSMADRAPDVAAALGDLRARVAAGALAVDVYLTASDFRGEPPAVAAIDAVDAAAILYFGGSTRPSSWPRRRGFAAPGPMPRSSSSPTGRASARRPQASTSTRRRSRCGWCTSAATSLRATTTRPSRRSRPAAAASPRRSARRWRGWRQARRHRSARPPRQPPPASRARCHRLAARRPGPEIPRSLRSPPRPTLADPTSSTATAGRSCAPPIWRPRGAGRPWQRRASRWPPRAAPMSAARARRPRHPRTRRCRRPRPRPCRCRPTRRSRRSRRGA